jgi:hypothetical protein
MTSDYILSFFIKKYVLQERLHNFLENKFSSIRDYILVYIFQKYSFICSNFIFNYKNSGIIFSLEGLIVDILNYHKNIIFSLKGLIVGIFITYCFHSGVFTEGEL